MKTGFSLNVLTTYQWPVDVLVPFTNEQGEGDFEIHRFIGEFKYLSMDESEELTRKLKEKIEQATAALLAQEGAESTDATPEQSKAPQQIPQLQSLEIAKIIADYEIESYRKIFTGWQQLTGANGEPMPITDENKLALLKQSIVRNAVVAAHRDSQGGEAARAKNSQTSRAAGQAAGEKSTAANA